MFFVFNVFVFADEEKSEESGDDEDEDDDEDDHGTLWDSGDVGGFECFIEADQDADNAEAAEVYRAAPARDKGEEAEEEDSKLLSVSAGCNVLSLVMRDEGIMKFVKYVSANAPGSR